MKVARTRYTSMQMEEAMKTEYAVCRCRIACLPVCVQATHGEFIRGFTWDIMQSAQKHTVKYAAAMSCL